MPVGLRFDTRDLTDLQIHMETAARGIRDKVLARSINKVASKTRTQAKRLISQESGFASSTVHQALTLRRASASAMPEATITASGRYKTVRHFKPKPGRLEAGRKFRGASPWRTSRTYKSAFVVRAKGSGELIPVVRTGPGRNELRGIYGPSIGKEASREYILSPLMAQVRRELPREVKRYATYLLSK